MRNAAMSMEKIITEILEIEENAKNRLTDAEQKCIRIISDAKAERETIINTKIREAEERIQAINSNEKLKAEKSLNEIEQNKIAEISRLDEIYNSRHVQWEDDIFNKIVNG